MQILIDHIFTAEGAENAELFIVTSACGASNNIKIFSELSAVNLVCI